MKAFLIGLSSLFLLSNAIAATGEGMSLARVAEVMTDNGYMVELGKDGAGDPVIYSEAAGLNFALFGFNCEAAGGCHEFMFSTYFDVDKAPPLSVLNAFNEQAVAGRAFLDEAGDPNLEHLFTLSDDDSALLERNLAIWKATMLEFADHLDSAREAGV